MHKAFFKHALMAGLSAFLFATAAPTSAVASSSVSGGAAQPASGSASGGAAQPAVGSVSGGAAAPAPGASGATPGSASRPTQATWYGPGFYGHRTACGQKLTPKLVGVASRTLPCGTLVQIDYRGHELTAPVLDRGPYGKNGAVWDLTSGAAHALEITETVRILTQIVGSVPNTPTLGEPSLASSPGLAGSSPLSGSPAAAPLAPTGGAVAG